MRVVLPGVMVRQRVWVCGGCRKLVVDGDAVNDAHLEMLKGLDNERVVA